jgi:RimJ/RimL family protein N-acetyltransferase
VELRGLEPLASCMPCGNHPGSALADEARQNGQDLVLDVLAVNRRAQALYQRLGMTEVARHGDGNIKITMRLTRQKR